MDKLSVDPCVVSPVTTLAIFINNKQDKLDELKDAVNSEVNLKLTFLHKSNVLRLKPDEIQRDLGLSKLPTEKQTNAYIEEKLSVEYDLLKIAEANTKWIKRDLGLLDDFIRLEEYLIKLELKE